MYVYADIPRSIVGRILFMENSRDDGKDNEC
jgi:hypothetical protein